MWCVGVSVFGCPFSVFHSDKHRPSLIIQVMELTCIFIHSIFAETQRERRELVTQTVTITTRRPRSGPRGNPGPGRLSNKTRPSVQDDSEPFNPDNPYHVRTLLVPHAQMNALNLTLECSVPRGFKQASSIQLRLLLNIVKVRLHLLVAGLMNAVRTG